MDYPYASSEGVSNAVSSEENDSDSEGDMFPEAGFARAGNENDEDDEEEEEEDDEDEDEDSESNYDSDTNEAPRDRKVKPRLTALPREKKKSRQNESETYSRSGQDAESEDLNDGDFVRSIKTIDESVINEPSSDSHDSANDVDVPEGQESGENAAAHKGGEKQTTRTTQQDCEPSADPAEVECVVTDTSDDEDISSGDEWNGDMKPVASSGRRRSADPVMSVKREPKDDDDVSLENGSGSRAEVPNIQCELCDSIFGPQECPKELLKHMQSVHKFSVRGLERDMTSNDGNDRPSSPVSTTADTPLGPRKAYNCEKERGGCGAVFFSRQGLSSHHARSQSAGGTCWLVATYVEEQRGPVYTCVFCSLGCVSRRIMLHHLEANHSCVRGPDEPAMATLALSCRVCGARFWSVEQRSAHEVDTHPDEAAYLMLKCYICKAGHSSKICLKKHVRRDHPKEEQFEAGVAFRCRICCMTFPNIGLIQEHFRERHPSVLVFRCRRCNLILKTKKTFQVHLKSTQCGAVRRECTLCNKVMWSKRAVSIHYRMKHSSSSRIGFMCRICKQRFDTKAERKVHYNSDHQGDSPFHCPICNKGFASKSGMYGHRQTHVKTGLSKCEFCGKEFTRRDSYNEHLLIHTGPRHKCPHCNKEFVQRSNLVRHIRIHTGEKPYKCSYCEKTFSDKGACNSHIRVHTREEACGCPYCGQVFSKKQKLKYHIRKHTGEGLVGCEFCGKMFTNSHSLKEHRAIHDRRTQILCSHCGKAFTTAKYLQRHIAMVHEALYVYNCPICDRGFSQQGRLRSHLMTHTGIKHLRCLLCTKAYSSRKSLRRHLLGLHGVPIEHPDYKMCFYAMTPEEAGLSLPDTQPTLRPRRDGTTAGQSNTPAGDSDSGSMPLLQPKVEPESADSGSDVKGGSSSEDEDDDDDDQGPPVLERQEPCTTVNGTVDVPAPTDISVLTVMRQVPFSGIRTKAARKQLPLNILVQDNNKLKGRGRPLKVDKVKSPKKAGKPRTPKEKPDSTTKAENGGGRVTRLVSPRGSFFEGFDLDSDSLSSTDSGSPRSSRTPKKSKGRTNEEDSWRPGKWKPKKKTPSPKKTAESNATEASPQLLQPPPGATNVSNVETATEPAKSNRRARYKLQNPKKRVLPQPEDIVERRERGDRHTGELGDLPQNMSQGNVCNQTVRVREDMETADGSLRYHYSNGNEEPKKVKRETLSENLQRGSPHNAVDRNTDDDDDEDEFDGSEAADVAAMVFDYYGRTNSSSQVKQEFNVSTGYVQESA